MNAELNGLGIDGTSVLLKAKSTPAAFHVVVPEHSRKRVILLSREDEKRIGEAVIADMNQGAFYSDATQETGTGDCPARQRGAAGAFSAEYLP